MEKKRNKKASRIVSVILTLALILGAVPGGGFRTATAATATVNVSGYGGNITGLAAAINSA